MSDATSEFRTRYAAMGLDGEPCSADEVDRVEQASGGVLPAAYKAYLSIAGREPPAAWVGSDCTVRHLPELFAAAEELLAENHQPPLPLQAFVFIMHQGYQFMYFIADGTSDDPPVFHYLEGEPKTVRRFERFSALIDVVARDGRDL